MATLNVSNFEFELVKKIKATPGSDSKELAILHKALNVLKTGAIFTVIQFSDLPDASDNIGKLYFVKNDSILYFSYVGFGGDEYWVPITSISSNSIWTWGAGTGGRLGDGTTVNRCSPGTVAGGGGNWCQISAAINFTSAIKTDGTLWTWGVNVVGRLGSGTVLSRSSPGTVAGGGTNWCLVSGTYSHGAAIKTDGTLWTWGCNSVGQLGDGTTVSRSSPGTVWGSYTTWRQVSAHRDLNSAIKNDGTLWTWGNNGLGQLGDGTTLNRCSPGTVAGGGTTWCQVSGSSNTSNAAIKNDGTLWTWGVNTNGQLGDGTVVSRSSPGTIAGGGTTWCQVFNYSNTIALKSDGTIWTWGCNRYGALGDGTTTNRSSPGTIAGGGTNWCQIAGRSYGVSAIKTDGTIWTWGCNTAGQLGDGTIVARCSPGTVAGVGAIWGQISLSAAITRETL